MKKCRSTESTYFEMLDWYFKRQQHTPLSPAAQALMSHIMNLCNQNYSDNCQIMEKLLSAYVNIDVRTVRTKMQELSEKGYVKFEMVAQGCYKITVGETENKAEVCTDATKAQQTCEKQSVITPISSYKEMEGNINKPKKERIVFRDNPWEEIEDDTSTAVSLGETQEDVARNRRKLYEGEGGLSYPA